MALVPILYLLASGESDRHGFEITAGAPGPTSPPPSPTWLSPDRIITESPTTTVTTTTTSITLEVATPAAPTTTTSTEVPATVATTTPPPTAEATTTPTTAPPAPPDTTTTTTTAPVPAASLSFVTPAVKPPTRSDRGKATWFNAPDGSCAHRTIPVGTIITVTRVSNSAKTTCYVDQWGPAEMSVVIDLSMDTFEKLAPASVGVIEVIIEW